MGKKINNDLLMSADPIAVAHAAMTVIDAMQTKFTPEQQLLGISAAFLLMADGLKTPAQDVFTAITNLMNGMDGKRAEFKAVTAYVNGELL
jgi:hypothetical protein